MNKYAFPYITNASFRMCELDDILIQNIHEEYRNSSAEELYRYATQRKILPFVAYLMGSMDLDRDFWNGVTEHYRKRNSTIIRALAQLFIQFEQYGVKKVFVSQNFGALLASGMDISLFASGDVDLCGDISEKKEIDKAFKDLGYIQKDRYCGKKLISSDYFNHNVLPQGFAIGIEYDTLSRLKLPNPIDMTDFVDWNRTMFYKDTRIVLPSIDELTYICLVHISLHSFSREPDIRLYVDIENCIRCNPNFKTVMSFAEKDNTVVRVLAAYILMSKLFDNKLNDAVMDAYYDKYAERVNSVIDLVYNPKKNELLYEPSHLKTLIIECAYYDTSGGLMRMLIPRKDWIFEVYGNSNIMAFVKHILRLLT